MSKKNKPQEGTEEAKEVETPVEPTAPAETVEYIRVSLVRKQKGNKKAEELHTEKVETIDDFAALVSKMSTMDQLKDYLRNDEARNKRRENARLDAKIAALTAKRNGVE